jgi:hypothetical protein
MLAMRKFEFNVRRDSGAHPSLPTETITVEDASLLQARYRASVEYAANNKIDPTSPDIKMELISYTSD